MSSKIRLVDGPEVREELLSEEEVAVHDYEMNTSIVVLALVVGGALFGLSGIVWWTSGLPDVSWVAVFALMSAGGLAIFGLVGYWYRFAAGRFVATSPDRLYVGEGEQMWSIDWSLVDREAVGFDEMAVTSVGGSIDLDVAGQEVEVKLYNSFVQLVDIQGFVLRLLEAVREKEEGEAADEAPEDDELEADEETSASDDD